MVFNKKEISKRLFKIRTDNNFSMQEFASIIGVSGKSTINEWEKGRSIPSKKTLSKINEKLQIDENYILYGDFSQYINDTLTDTFKNRSDEQLSSTFFDYLNEIDASSRFKSYEESQVIETIQDQIKVREEILNMSIEATINDTLDALTDFLIQHQITFSTPINHTLQGINNFFLKKLNRLNTTKHGYIQELISNSELTSYNLDNLDQSDSDSIKLAIADFQSKLLRIDD